MVCHPVHRHRWANRAWLICASVTPGSGVRVANRITIPGVQNPHWLPPVATNAPAQRSRSARWREPVERGHLAALQSSYRGDAGHPGSPVHPHRAATALALRAAAVLDRADAQLVAE